jgi:hypothetical protein
MAPGFTLQETNAALRDAVEARLAAGMSGILGEGDDRVIPEDLAELPRLRGDGLLSAPQRHPSSMAFIRLLDEMRALHESKSADYGSDDDPLANIRQGATFVSIEPWRGCMVRIADKVQRLRTYCRTGRLVHEGVRDTLLDLAAYSLLAIVLFDEGRDG